MLIWTWLCYPNSDIVRVFLAFEEVLSFLSIMTERLCLHVYNLEISCLFSLSSFKRLKTCLLSDLSISSSSLAKLSDYVVKLRVYNHIVEWSEREHTLLWWLSFMVAFRNNIVLHLSTLPDWKGTPSPFWEGLMTRMSCCGRRMVLIVGTAELVFIMSYFHLWVCFYLCMNY